MAQRADGRHPDDLNCLVCKSEVIPLAEPEVVDIDHHLGEQPLPRAVERCVDKTVGAIVRPDC